MANSALQHADTLSSDAEITKAQVEDLSNGKQHANGN
jgi:hypothetical protein